MSSSIEPNVIGGQLHCVDVSAPDLKTAASPGFSDLGLSSNLLETLLADNYLEPTPIQLRAIPPMLLGRDIVAQAQTGTGKTAAFALPLLDRIDMKRRQTQVLVLAPTRELAQQVSAFFARYGRKFPQLNVLPIYGGQSYTIQADGLRRGPQVVVGTPGRVIDQIERGALKLDSISCLVLDEADEMLNMGFIDDVELILKKTPETRQIALFSATMPPAIRRIASGYLKDPYEVQTKKELTAAETINQRYWIVQDVNRLDALTRILEAEERDGVIVFMRTKLGTLELCDQLSGRGFSCVALNGDMEQKQRDHTVEQFKRGRLDILVATDVAARGLDVTRVSHVINYEAPNDCESYVHRIGRTGRAGRTGEAIIFLSPREQSILRSIERNMRVRIKPMDLPTMADISKRRVEVFSKRMEQVLERTDLADYKLFAQTYAEEKGIDITVVAAALAKLAEGAQPLFVKETLPPVRSKRVRGSEARDNREGRSRREDRREDRARPSAARRGEKSFRENHPAREKYAARDDHAAQRPRSEQPRPTSPRAFLDELVMEHSERGYKAKRKRERTEVETGMECYQLDIGRVHGAKPGHIVGAIANEAELNSRYINNLRIYDNHSTVELPEGMPREVLRALKKAWVAGRQLNISRMQEA